MKDTKYYYFFEDNVFYPVHWVVEEQLVEIDIKMVGLRSDLRYLYSCHPEKVTVQLGASLQRDYSDHSTPPYSALVTGKFYQHKTTKTIYYEGGFSIV